MGGHARRAAHWRATRQVSVGVIVLWAVVTIATAWWSTALPYGVVAQGTLAAYVVLAWSYVVAMHRIDRRYGLDADVVTDDVTTDDAATDDAATDDTLVDRSADAS